MRILFITDSTVAETRGGAEVSAFQLALGLTEMGHDVVIATRSAGGDLYEGQFLNKTYSAPRWHVPTAGGHLETGIVGSAPLSSIIRKACAENDFDVVHAHNWVSALAASIAKPSMGRASEIPWILSIRDYRFVCPGTYGWCFGSYEGCGMATSTRCIAQHTPASTATKVAGLLPYSAFRNTTWRMLRTSLDSFDAFVACSGFLRRRFELLHPSAREVQAIHNPVTIGNETPVPEDRILYVGRLSIEKGTMVLLKAFSALLEDRPESRLTIVGTGPLEGRLRRGVSDSAQLKNSVTIAGYVPPPEVSRFFERSSIVVVPSVWPEPFGRTPAEAMAAARPVIASSSGGIPEVVEHGKTGLLVSPGKPEALSVALGELLPDRRKIVKMGHRGHERAARTFSRRVIASKFAGLYEKIT